MRTAVIPAMGIPPVGTRTAVPPMVEIPRPWLRGTRAVPTVEGPWPSAIPTRPAPSRPARTSPRDKARTARPAAIRVTRKVAGRAVRHCPGTRVRRATERAVRRRPLPPTSAPIRTSRPRRRRARSRVTRTREGTPRTRAREPPPRRRTLRKHRSHPPYEGGTTAPDDHGPRLRGVVRTGRVGDHLPRRAAPAAHISPTARAAVAAVRIGTVGIPQHFLAPLDPTGEH